MQESLPMQDCEVKNKKKDLKDSKQQGGLSQETKQILKEEDWNYSQARGWKSNIKKQTEHVNIYNEWGIYRLGWYRRVEEELREAGFCIHLPLFHHLPLFSDIMSSSEALLI